MAGRPGAKRKHHNKSRLGCQTCKRRKVKCDEVRPSCGNCTRFGTCCDFSPITPQAIQHSLDATASSSRPRRRGRPRSNWASWAERLRQDSSHDTSSPPSSSSSPSTATPNLNLSLNPVNVDDIALFHNWTTQTAPSLGGKDDKGGNGLWREGAVQVGLQHPCILNLILALSAYHLARSQPADAARYVELGGRHSATALQEAKLFVRRLEPENSPALYILSVLVCFTTLAQGPSPGNLLLVAGDGRVSWLSLLRGVRLVISATGWSHIFSGPLAPYFPAPPEAEPSEDEETRREIEQEQEQEQEQRTESGSNHVPGEGTPTASPASTSTLTPCGTEDWRSSLNDISNLIDVCGENSLRAAYKHELEVLTKAYETTFGGGKHGAAQADVRGEMQTVMAWIYQLDDPFVEGLNGRDPIAMIILGHFCVLLHTLRRYWFTEGWASHVIGEIVQTSEASRKWLAWPVGYIRGEFGSSTP